MGVAGRLSGTVSPFRAEQGTSLESRDSRARTRSPSPRAWRPDFPGAAARENPRDATVMQTRDPCRPWRATLDPGQKPRLGLFCPAVTLAQSPAPPHNPNGRLDFKANKRKPKFPVITREFSSYDGDLSLPLGLALGSPIFPSGEPGVSGDFWPGTLGNILGSL